MAEAVADIKGYVAVVTKLPARAVASISSRCRGRCPVQQMSYLSATIVCMEKKIWTAAELEKMTPAERSAISRAAEIRDINDAPPEMVARARDFVLDRIAAEARAKVS